MLNMCVCSEKSNKIPYNDIFLLSFNGILQSNLVNFNPGKEMDQTIREIFCLINFLDIGVGIFLNLRAFLINYLRITAQVSY